MYFSTIKTTFSVALVAGYICSSCGSASFSGSSKSPDPAPVKAPTSATNAQAQPVATPSPVPTVGPVEVPQTVVPVVPMVNVPPTAVTQGSFTAWAFPAMPMPGQDYDIHIVVRVPSTSTMYSVTDLSGLLIGTDGYQQAINQYGGMIGSAFQQFNYIPGSSQAELVMHVPGAMKFVRDTINIHSNVLSESQTISIIFQ